MKIARIFFFILFAACIFSTRVCAQENLFNASDLRNVNVDSYSDDELISMLKKASESGFSESQLLKLASDKGLPEGEMEKLRTRLEVLIKKKFF